MLWGKLQPLCLMSYCSDSLLLIRLDLGKVGQEMRVQVSPKHLFFLNKFIYLFIYLFLFSAVLGLRFCARAFSSCGKRGPLFIAVRGSLTIAVSLVAEHRLQMRRLSSCGSTGLVAPWHVGSSQTRAQTRVPCISRQSLNHCATREALHPSFTYF